MEKEADDLLVNLIRDGGPSREKALHKIYLNQAIKSKLISIIINNSGNLQDGEDMYQEAIIVLDRNIREGNYRSDGSLSSYLLSIGKFLWMNHLRKKRLTLKESFLDSDLINLDLVPDKLMMQDQRKDLLVSILGKLGQRCQRILELWQLSYSMEEIANAVGLNDASVARKAKYDCQQQLIKLIQSHPALQSELE